MQIKKFLKLDIAHNRIFGFDILRILAILFVVFSHSTSLLPDTVYMFFDLFYFDGVCIFFALSGFIIGNIMIKSVEKYRVHCIEEYILLDSIHLGSINPV
ncbi:acyltransferase [Chryseobacterium carnipullorum]|uniref:Acyltransferase n=1 Tax=Chryseobacterium carnipullorum TaxID=1124835 RepID=A0A3G6NFV6_CHRCU|nr:acyltransferase [Chryseobacterium carnipullorum]AZA47488.1 acyltransferase [Chryseobacterium carnipullorum]AZA66824.1 acyltransferase [Chryseobacterium carnipullorum]